MPMLLENSPMRQSRPDGIGNREDYIESAIGINPKTVMVECRWIKISGQLSERYLDYYISSFGIASIDHMKKTYTA
ncbi:MAG: hypothetical protein CVT92_07270 [Bacteroidetes bacterium HGW-Bacteroidetes-1]|jgi:hypothetical protein|nr:MAG: hypothetical protein CVT92_07270 [Bacteroidetes bacterium HGW-Bacteroidetes-1]